MKTYHQDVRDEFYRQNGFAVDLIEIHLKDVSGNNDTLYLCSGGIDIDYNSPTAPDAGTNSYSAQGEFISYSGISEEFDVVVGKFQLALSGLPTGFVDRFISKNAEGKRVCVYKAFLSTQDLQIIQTPILMYDGAIYNVSVQETAASCSIGVEVASQFADFERTAGRKTNNWSNWIFQRKKYDTSMEKSGYVGNTEFLWGRTS